jgi:hypothetical protein
MTFGLQTARAVVIDNVYEEVEGVFRALSQMQVGSIFLNGDVETIDEDRKLKGIRLAFVDMDLQADGSASDEEKGANAASYVASVLEADNGLFLVFTWTRNPGAVEKFREELRTLLPNSITVVVDSMTKPDGLDPLKDAEEIVKGIVAALREFTGLSLIWEWEQLSHDAVTQTSESLIEVVRRDSNIQLSNSAETAAGMLSVFSALAYAARERLALDGRQVAVDIFAALSVILQDHAESHLGSILESDEENWSYLHEALKHFLKHRKKNLMKRAIVNQFDYARTAAQNHPALNDVNCISDPETGDQIEDASQKRDHLKKVFSSEHVETFEVEDHVRLSRLNRMVHLSRAVRGAEPVLPGNAYAFAKTGTSSDEFGELLGITPTDLIADAVRNCSGQSRALMIEVSPACDIAQGKVGLPRFIGACLISAENSGKVPRHTTFLYEQCGVFRFDAGDIYQVPEGEYILVLNARYQTGVPIAKVTEWKPVFRIRQNTLVDVQAWLSRHGNRPGTITVVR